MSWLDESSELQNHFLSLTFDPQLPTHPSIRLLLLACPFPTGHPEAGSREAAGWVCGLMASEEERLGWLIGGSGHWMKSTLWFSSLLLDPSWIHRRASLHYLLACTPPASCVRYCMLLLLGAHQFLILLFHSFTFPAFQSNPNPTVQAWLTIVQSWLDVKELTYVKKPKIHSIFIWKYR